MAAYLWTLRVDRPLTESEYHTLVELLPPRRRKRLLHEPAVKHAEVLCAYGLLLVLLREQNGWGKLPSIEVNAAGKPFFSAYPSVYFSLSHTAGAAAAVVGDVPVGIDIQRIRDVPSRSGKLRGEMESPERFFQNWVRWEARAKRAGSGLLRMVRHELPLAEGEFYSELECFPGYAAGVAANGSVLQIFQRLLYLDDLMGMLESFDTHENGPA